MAKAKSKAKKAAAELNPYEAMFLLGAAFTADLDNGMTIVRGMVERHGGEILVLKKWDERKLAYEVGGEKRGVYLICFFKGPPAAVAAIERDVNLSDQVLRVLVTRADHLNAEEMAAVEPQPILPREERNPWDRPLYDERPSPRRDRPARTGREESTEAIAKE
jgi:small subunit ribosomal protein S6